MGDELDMVTVLTALMETLHEQFDFKLGAEAMYGIVLMLFPLEGDDNLGRCHFISNARDRKRIGQLLMEVGRRLEAEPRPH
jgi:hypothetical protein